MGVSDPSSFSSTATKHLMRGKRRRSSTHEGVSVSGSKGGVWAAMTGIGAGIGVAEAEVDGGQYPSEAGAVWTYLTTDQPFGGWTERVLAGLRRSTIESGPASAQGLER